MPGDPRPEHDTGQTGGGRFAALPGPDEAAHLCVTRANAISHRGTVTCCYANPVTALRDAWDPSPDLRPWNNTSVAVRWEPGHAAAQRRTAEYAAHSEREHRWLWSPWPCEGKGQPCAVAAQHQEQAAAEIAAAAAAASGITPADGPGGAAHAATPPGPDPGPPWRPAADVLTRPRRGRIVLDPCGLDQETVTTVAARLSSGLDGTLTVLGAASRGTSASRPGQRIALAALTMPASSAPAVLHAVSINAGASLPWVVIRYRQDGQDRYAACEQRGTHWLMTDVMLTRTEAATWLPAGAAPVAGPVPAAAAWLSRLTGQPPHAAGQASTVLAPPRYRPRPGYVPTRGRAAR